MAVAACLLGKPLSGDGEDAVAGFVGGTAGDNWQAGNVVFGLEADGAWADVSASRRPLPSAFGAAPWSSP